MSRRWLRLALMELIWTGEEASGRLQCGIRQEYHIIYIHTYNLFQMKPGDFNHYYYYTAINHNHVYFSTVGPVGDLGSELPSL